MARNNYCLFQPTGCRPALRRVGHQRLRVSAFSGREVVQVDGAADPLRALVGLARARLVGKVGKGGSSHGKKVHQLFAI